MDKQYVWGIRYIDELVCRDDATPERLYATQDANFNLTGITDTSGNPLERYLFDPYGNPTIMDGSFNIIGSSAYSWVIGHQGLMVDGESGLIYNRWRILLPAIGGFSQRDPMQYVDSPNTYLYLLGNPIRFLDPSGTETTIVGGAGAPVNPDPPIRTLPGPVGKGGGKSAGGEGQQQNCLGRSLCNRQEHVKWPFLNDNPTPSDVKNALAFVPTGCTRVECGGISAAKTKCNEGDTELIVFIYILKSALNFHAVGRVIGKNASPWTTKQGDGPIYNDIWDPDQNLKDLEDTDSKAHKLCFCCDCSKVATK